MKNHQGFSLIELMIVIAIIGILAVISLPSYQTYTARARFTEVVTATLPFKTAITLALQQGALPDELTHGVFGIPSEPLPTKNVASIKVTSGVITATSTPKAGDATLILTPIADGSTWSIDGTCQSKGLCNF